MVFYKYIKNDYLYKISISSEVKLVNVERNHLISGFCRLVSYKRTLGIIYSSVDAMYKVPPFNEKQLMHSKLVIFKVKLEGVTYRNPPLFLDFAYFT